MIKHKASNMRVSNLSDSISNEIKEVVDDRNEQKYHNQKQH